MQEKIILRIANHVLTRLIVSATFVCVPLGLTVSWEAAAYLHAYTGVPFFQMTLRILGLGMLVIMLGAVPLAYIGERWIIKDKAKTSWRWIFIRMVMFMILAVPIGFGLLVVLRLALQPLPSIVETTYFVMTIANSTVIASLYTFIERAAEIAQQREARLMTQIHELRIEIDQVKQQMQVKEIVDNDFFRDLKAKATELRQQQTKRSDAPDNATGLTP